MGMIILWVIVAIFILWIVASYNNLVSLRNRVDLTWSQIDVILKKRYDLIPNLMETVKGYAAHEKEVLLGVTEARNMASKATTVAEQAQADNMLSGTLKSLFAVAENYPDLKANENFLDFQNELSDIETKISYQRQFYNDAVFAFNTYIQQFPGVIFASIFHFTIREYFKVEETEKQNVKVKF